MTENRFRNTKPERWKITAVLTHQQLQALVASANYLLQGVESGRVRMDKEDRQILAHTKDVLWMQTSGSEKPLHSQHPRPRLGWDSVDYAEALEEWEERWAGEEPVVKVELNGPIEW